MFAPMRANRCFDQVGFQLSSPSQSLSLVLDFFAQLRELEPHQKLVHCGQPGWPQGGPKAATLDITSGSSTVGLLALIPASYAPGR
jgi:hypothetical protein